MQGKRTGKLTDAETYRMVFERGKSPKELAEFEGIKKQGIYLRLSRERQRRLAAGLEVHHGKRGRKPAVAAPAIPRGFLIVEPDATFARMDDGSIRQVYEGIFDGLNEAIARLELGVEAT